MKALLLLLLAAPLYGDEQTWQAEERIPVSQRGVWLPDAVKDLERDQAEKSGPSPWGSDWTDEAVDRAVQGRGGNPMITPRQAQGVGEEGPWGGSR